MRKTSSKSVLSTRKTKAAVTVPQSKKVSRVTKTNSCIKINSQNTQHNSNYNATIPLKGTLQQLSEKLLAQLSSKQCNTYQKSHHIDKGSLRQSHRSTRNEKVGKTSTETIPNQSYNEEMKKIKGKNEELVKENTTLKQKCCDLQEMSLKDKQKIKNLIIRINEVKQQGRGMTTEAKTMHPSTSNLPLFQVSSAISCAVLSHKKKLDSPARAINNGGVCSSQQCVERKKYLQSQLYKQRISRDRLEMQKREWQRNKQQLKRQYNQLLDQIRQMRDDEN